MMGWWWNSMTAEADRERRAALRSRHERHPLPRRSRRRAGTSPVLALGNFDGLHRGHLKIIDRVRRRAGERGGTPAAMTFDPHPPRVVRPDKAPPLLMTKDAEARGARPRRHAGRRGRALHARAVAVGSGDVRAHGARRLAARRRSLGRRELPVRPRSRRQLLAAAQRSARATGSAPRRSIRSATRTSSSAARASAGWSAKGASTKRARCSAITTSSTARWSRGAGRGRELGFPTANLETANELLPPPGVYATTRRRSTASCYPSVTNIGVRPTFGDVDRTDDRDAHLRPRPRSVRRDAPAVVRPAAARRARVPGCRRAARADRRRLPQRAAAVRPHFAVESAAMSESRGPSAESTLVLRLSVPAGGELRAIAAEHGREGGRVSRRRRARRRAAGRGARRRSRRSVAPAAADADDRRSSSAQSTASC